MEKPSAKKMIEMYAALRDAALHVDKKKPLDPSFSGMTTKVEEPPSVDKVKEYIEAAAPMPASPTYVGSSSTLSGLGGIYGTSTYEPTTVNIGGISSVVAKYASEIGVNLTANDMYNICTPLIGDATSSYSGRVIHRELVREAVYNYYNARNNEHSSTKPFDTITADDVMDKLPPDLFLCNDKDTLRSIVDTVLEVMRK